MQRLSPPIPRWQVVRVDINPSFNPTIVADVTEHDLRSLEIEGSHRWGRLIAMRAATNQYDIRDLETNETIILKRYDFKRKRVYASKLR